MKKLIVANWKMNPATYEEANDLIAKVISSTSKASGVEIVFCPPFPWLTDFSHKNTSSAYFGAQNVAKEEEGAFTGEVSALMLKNSKVDYVIVGHSERRKYFGETNEIVNEKIKIALAVGLKVIFCIGENDGEDKESILKQQIEEGLDGVSDLENIIIAYEPVWAIGTGKNCSIEETKSSVALIKKLLGQTSSKILYGGSVNAENASGYLNEADVDGLLVGGASLKAEEFIKIVTSAGA